jgi:hypothetical protein
LCKSNGQQAGEKNSRFGDHRNYEELHGVEKAQRLRKQQSTVRKGAGNTNAKEWKLVDSSGKVYLIRGILEEFCQQHNLSESGLYNHIGEVYKMPYNASMKTREIKRNTVGWTLYRV